MVFCTCLPGLLQKHARVDSANKRPMVEECLPMDALDRPMVEECLPLDAFEAIMGFLDRETLCTARLVSKTFCAAASAHVSSLTLASTSKAVSFHRFPHLRHVTVKHTLFLDEEVETLAQSDPRLRDAATALTVRFRTHRDPWCARSSASIAQTRGYLSQAALIPKLQGLVVEGVVEHEPALVARCTNLEAIRFAQCRISVARTIVTMTRLTFLAIQLVRRDEDQMVSADTSWLEHATNLKSLQSLRIHTFDGALPLIANLTGLTDLAIWFYEASNPTYSIAPLTRLTRLKSLYIGSSMTEDNLGIACSLGLGCLVDLGLGVCEEASADCGRFLTHQTALTRLTLRGRQLCNLRHIGGVRIELLQCLKLHEFDVLDAEGLSVLRRATSLTKFSMTASTKQPQMGLSQVLARLTQLRSLKLEWVHRRHDAPNVLDLPLALSPLTALTKLHLYPHRLDDGDLGVILVLTGLRVLELRLCDVTDDMLPELGVLTSLSALTISDCGITSLAPVREVLDPLRNARGLPPLHTSLW